MKRSLVNHLILDAIEFFDRQNFHLPPFAFWTPEVWRTKGPEVAEIVEGQLGWDVTDYGTGDFYKTGLLLFTIRNGNPRTWQTQPGKQYGEKVVILELGQEHQLHFHWKKTEDIINRAGGILAMQLYKADEKEEPSDQDIHVSTDGVQRVVQAGGVVMLAPGESITLTPYTYHRFWAVGQRVMMGEVSLVNDDTSDNRFWNRIGSGRYGSIEEDEPPHYLLFSDYEKYWSMKQ